MCAMEWNPGSLLALSGSYWQTFTLHTGVKLDLFSVVANRTLSAEEIAERLRADLRGITMLLNALVAMKLLIKRDGRFTAAEPAQKFLDRSASSYIGHMIMHHHYLVAPWSRLDEAVISGQPQRSRAADGDEGRREAFLMGMYNLASQQAPQIAARIDMRGRQRLLDLGGGPGTYAIYFCLQYKQLKADIIDLPTTRKFADRMIAKHGVVDRVSFVEADFNTDNILGKYDIAWLSHILHAEGPDECRTIIQKVSNALEPNGMILVHDFVLEDTMDRPLFAALFALNMLQGTRRGQTYSESQIHSMLRHAGIGKIRKLDYTGPTESSILVGFKKN